MIIEQVNWIDAHGVTQDWQEVDEIEENVCKVTSFGVVIKETDDAIYIAPHAAFSIKTPQYCGVMIIPKVAILKRIILIGDTNE